MGQALPKPALRPFLGEDTPVLAARPAADALFPNVAYAEALGEYVMVFNILYYADLSEGAVATGGIFAAFSADGIQWSRPQLLVRGLSIGLSRPGSALASGDRLG